MFLIERCGFFFSFFVLDSFLLEMHLKRLILQEKQRETWVLLLLYWVSDDCSVSVEHSLNHDSHIASSLQCTMGAVNVKHKVSNPGGDINELQSENTLDDSM